MQSKLLKFLMLLVFSCLSFSAFSATNNTIKGTYKIVINGYEFGPAVDKVIVKLDKKVIGITSDLFNVKETKKWYTENPQEVFDRKVTKAYLSDKDGNEIRTASDYIALELYVSPTDGSPLLYSFDRRFNEWNKLYYLTINLKDGKTLVGYDNTKNAITINEKYTDRIMLIGDKFEQSKYSYKNLALGYTYFTPKKDNSKKPLIIWLHGGGEGGKDINDSSVALMGNRVSILGTDEIQKVFGGAYVLVPQCPTLWMDSGSGDFYKFDGTSIYEDALINLIKDFVKKNPEVDTKRIIVGGCSNGGYMTLRLIEKNPNYFAAAFPICEGYYNKFITNNTIENLKSTSIWFTHAKNDQVLNPEETTIPLVKRLKESGAKNVILSLYDKVVDPTGLYKDDKGNAFEYNGHFSWVYALNNTNEENGVKMFEWLAKQSK